MSKPSLLLLVQNTFAWTTISSSWPIGVNWGAQSTGKEEKAALTEHVEATVSHQQEITQFTEADNEIFEKVQGSMISTHMRIANPFPDQTPSHLLQRNFRVADIVWSPTSVGYTLDFPEVLFAQTQISDTLQSFLYFMADVEFEVRITSTAYHIGAMQVSYLPAYVGPDPDVWRASGNHATVLSFNTSDAATIRVPYVNPLTWLRWKTCSPAAICRIYLHSLFPLIQTSDTTSANCAVQIMASFKDVKVAGYLHTTPGVKRTITQPLVRKIEVDYNIPPSSPKKEKKKKKESKPLRVEAQSAFGRDRKKRVISVHDMPDHPDEEAKEKTKSGLESGLSAVGAFAKSGIPILSSIGHVVSGITHLFKAFSIFDKPNSVGVPSRMVIQHTADAVHGDGLSMATSLGLSQSTYMSSPGVLDPGETSSMAVATLAGMPMLHLVSIFNNTDSQSVTWVALPQFYANASNQGDFVMNLSDSYKYWRGSFKYFIAFYTTPFTTCRFRISLNYTTWSSDVLPSGDIVSKIVDVKGDTFVDMTVPYLADTHWTAVKDPISTSFPRVVVDEMVPIIGQSVESDPVIRIVVYRAAGEDFEFAQLIHTDQFVPTDENVADMLRVEAQGDMRARFSKNFPHIVNGCQQTLEQGFVMSEVAGGIAAVLKRMSKLDDSSYVDRPNDEVNSNESFEPFFQFSKYFLFWRGSRNVKVGNVSGWVGVGMSDIGRADDVSDQSGSGVLWQSPDRPYPFVDASVPYYSQLPYYPIVPEFSAVDNVDMYVPSTGTAFSNSGDYGPVFLGAGDDFQYLWVAAPPRYPSPGKKSFKKTSSDDAKNPTPEPTVRIDNVFRPAD